MFGRDSSVLPAPRLAGNEAVTQPAPVETQHQRVREAHLELTYRPDIEGLRGLAVGLVVAYHAFPGFRSGGFVGVDVFFVISGYLITRLILRGLQPRTFSLVEFYRRRVLRIVPALLVVLGVSCILGWLLLLPSELRLFGGSVKWASLLLANAFFAMQTGGYFDPASESNPLLHLWSLGVEEQFYLTWPVLLMLARWRGATVQVLAAVIALSLGVSIWSAWFGPSPHFFNPVPRAWELAAGGMLAAWQLRTPRTAAEGSSVIPRRGAADAISVMGPVLILAGGALWTVAARIPGIWSVIPVAGAVLIIASGPGSIGNRWFLANRPMTFIGRISYPLYLWHWPLFSFTRITLGHPAAPIAAAAEIIIALAAAYATYRWVERPLRYGRFGRITAPALLLGLVFLALLGGAIQSQWLGGRLAGPMVSQWDAAVTDWHFEGDTAFDKTGFGTVTVPSRGKHKVLFLGDSHIQQYWPRVKRIIDSHPDSARSAIFVSYTAWPPLPGIGRRYHADESRTFFGRAMQLANQPDVDTVVIGAFWELYFLGEYSPDHNSHETYGVPQPPLQLDSPATQVAFAQFQQAIAELLARGRRVFIILSNPTSPLFVPVFPAEARLSLRSPARLGNAKAARIDAAPFESFAAPVMTQLRAIAARTGATVVDPRLTLCEGMMCPIADADDMPLYLDSNHLNGANARERASFVDEMLLGAR